MPVKAVLTFFFCPCAALLTRLRLLITSVLRLIGRGVPCNFRKSPQALQSTDPISSRRHSGVVEVVQFWHTGWRFPRRWSANEAMLKFEAIRDFGGQKLGDNGSPAEANMKKGANSQERCLKPRGSPPEMMWHRSCCDSHYYCMLCCCTPTLAMDGFDVEVVLHASALCDNVPRVAVASVKPKH